MKKNLYSVHHYPGRSICALQKSRMSPKSLLLLCLFIMGTVGSTFAQSGYIYIHKKTQDEASSIDFNFTVTGGPTTVAPFVLNDKPDYNAMEDIGSSQNGRLYAVGENNTLYYRDLGNDQWIAVTTPTGVTRVDGGSGSTAYYVTTAGNVVLFDGISTFTTIYTGADATDVGSAWNSNPYIVANGGRIYRYTGSGSGGPNSAAWPRLENNNVTDNLRIDGNPATGGAVVSKTDQNVYTISSTGVIASIGRPAASDLSAGVTADDVAVDAAGAIYAVYKENSGNQIVFKYQSGTTWSGEEVTSRNVKVLTAGIAGEVWGIYQANFLNNLYGSIYSRSMAGTAIWWIDDERVRTSEDGNSIMIAVAPGTYTLTETVPTGWNLQDIELYDPTSNSTTTIATNSAALNVAAGEIVHAIVVNGLITLTPITNNCGQRYLENFKTVAEVGRFGPPFLGQTSYHYLGVAGNTEDGYYKIVSISNDFRTTSQQGLVDHTVGDVEGHMLLVNAAYDQNEFFRRRFTGLIVGATYDFSAWAMNVSHSEIKPNVSFEVVNTTTENVIATTNTGTTLTPTGVWVQTTLTFVATSTEVDLILQNNTIGGNGNDLAIDDITFGLKPSAPPVAAVTNASCTTPTGSITVTSPASASYEYSRDGTNWQSSPTFSNLAPGNYTIQARFVGTVNCESASTAVNVGIGICGNVFTDADRLTDNLVDGTGTNGSNTLRAVLYNNTTGKVEAVVSVATDGSYTLGASSGQNYSVYLTTNTVTVGQTATPTPRVPLGSYMTGEQIGTTAGTGVDATTNGVLNLGVVSNSVSNVNFGINAVCSGNTIFAVQEASGGGGIRPFVDVNVNAAQGAPINTAAYPIADLNANAIAYNRVDGKFYYFFHSGSNGNSNQNPGTRQFGSYDPATNTYELLPNYTSPAGGFEQAIRGAVTQDGTGYYTIVGNAQQLMYYNIAAKTWTNITTNYVDQFGNTLNVVGSGDVAIDGSGNLYLLTSDVTNGKFRILKLAAPLPTTAVAQVTMTNVATGDLPGTQIANGIAFTATGEIIVSTAGSLYRINNDFTTSFIGAQSVGSTGDLTGCAYPLNPLAGLDFGDAPDTYGTLLAGNGPRHEASAYNATNNTAPLMLGSLLDLESNGTAGTATTGDDAASTDDEDAAAPATITVPANLVVSSYSLPVSYTNTTGSPATIRAWIDWNGNGTFEAGESQSATVNSSGTHTFTWTNQSLAGIPLGRTGTYARIRMASVASEVANPTGAAASGEVEDYFIPFNAPLPVTLGSFTAQKAGSQTLVNWLTTLELNSQSFVVERSANGVDFTAIGTVAASGNATGSSYRFTDAAPLSGANFYRLRMVDRDGTYAYSPVARVEHGTGTVVITLYPNPARDKATLQGVQAGWTVRMMSATGAVVRTEKTVGAAHTVYLGGLTSGLYSVEVRNAQGVQVHTQKLFKQ